MINHEQFLRIAEVVAESSYSTRAKVGSIIVKDGNIISIGYNGTPKGFDNNCETDGKTKPEVLHAESNAILKCSRSTYSSQGATLYTTLAPCFDCAKLIIQAGINTVVFRDKYTNDDGLNLLIKAEIEIICN